ncbi:MAG: phage holin family protein [Terriglobales bacterium]|jgi:putative membrane protein
MRLLLHWVLSALALLLVSHFVPGFIVSGLLVALIAAVVIGFVNATVGTFLRIISFPITILTLGLFVLVINALMLKLAAMFLPRFQIIGFIPALEGAIILAVAHMIIRWITEPSRGRNA